MHPYAEWRVVHYLLDNSDIYKNENIQLNTDWLNSISDESSSLVKGVEIFDPISEHFCDDDYGTNIVTERDISKPATDEAISVVTEPDIRNVNSQMLPIQCNHGDQNNNKNVQNDSGENDNINQLNMNTPCLQKFNNDNIEIMDMNEVDEDSNVIHHDTLLHEEDISHADPESFPYELIFAPGKGHRPMSIFQDADVEYLAFSTIFVAKDERRMGTR